MLDNRNPSPQETPSELEEDDMVSTICVSTIPTEHYRNTWLTHPSPQEEAEDRRQLSRGANPWDKPQEEVSVQQSQISGKERKAFQLEGASSVQGAGKAGSAPHRASAGEWEDMESGGLQRSGCKASKMELMIPSAQPNSQC